MAPPKGQPRAPRREYSEEDIAHALAAYEVNRGNLKRTARELGMSHVTLRHWVDGKRRRPETQMAVVEREEAQELQRKEVITQWSQLRGLALERAKQTVQNASARDAAWIAGVAHDKVEVGLGRPISRSETTLSLADLYRKHLPTIEVRPVKSLGSVVEGVVEES